MRIYIHIHKCLCVHMCIYTCICIDMYLCICICMFVYTNTYICICICIGPGSGSAGSPCPIPPSHGSPMQHQLRSVETASPLDKPPSDEQASDKTPRSKFDRGSVDDQPTGMIRHVSQRTHGAIVWKTRGFIGKAAPQQISHWREGETLNEEQRGTDMESAQNLGRGRSELLRRYLHVVGREGRGALGYPQVPAFGWVG